jgi:hypothetical protein
MNTNLNSPIAASRTLSSEGWATVAGVLGSAILLARKFLSPKASKPELITRGDFYAEMVVSRDRAHADRLALLEKLDANHRELLAGLERLGARVSGLEASVARLDERTGK